MKLTILREALDAFEKATKIKAYLVDDMIQYAPPDVGKIIIQINVNDEDIFIEGEIKPNITDMNYAAVINQLNTNRDYKPVLITRYVTPLMADHLRDVDIQFIDTAGNVFLNYPPLYIFVKGNKVPKEFRPERQVRAFQPTGLQVLFALMCNPGLENAPMRQIAAKANVALGTVGWVMRDLRQLAFIIELGRRGRRLVKKEKLLERWVTAYPEKFRPKQLIGRYRAKEFNWWKNAKLNNYNAYWGGETAAAKLTNYLKPEIVTVYIGPKANKLLIDNRIRKDPAGDIELRRIFWNFEFEEPYHDFVHPILIYADLLATGDPRNIETANVIYEREFFRFIREN